MKLIFVFLALLLMIKTVVAVPVWSNAYPSVSNVTYFPKEKFSFQINWTDSDGYKITNVIFESNFSGSLNNTTASNKSNVYFVNFTDLPVGAYLYRWYTVDNESNWNSTDQFNYVVNKNSSVNIKLYLNGAQANKEYNLNSIANFTASLSIPNKTIYLDSNYTDFVLQNSSSSRIVSLTNLTSQNIFSITAYWNGDENYSASSQTYYFDDISPRFLSRSEYPPTPTYYKPNVAYTFGSSWYDLNVSQVLFESNFSGSSRDYSAGTTPYVQNNSNNFLIMIQDLHAGTFLYRWIASNSINRASNSTWYEYDILKELPLSIEVIPNETVLLGTETTVICSSSTSQIPASSFKLYRNNSLIANDTLQSRSDKQALRIGVYNYVCNSTGNQNFSSQTIGITLSVVLTLHPVETVSLNLTGPPSIKANVGENVEADFHLENNLGYSLDKLLVDLTGLPSDWYEISELPTSTLNNFSLLIKINFSIPSDAGQGDYNFTLRALGTTPSNVTKATTKLVTLSITTPPQPQNFPPMYSTSLTSETANGYKFSSKWNDDNGLSGYIFSSNMSGTWKNDSLVSLTGTEAIVSVTKNISLSPGQTIAWKVYAVDTDNLWTESQEFYLTASKKKPDIVFLIMAVSLFVVGLAALLLFLTHLKSKKAPKKENKVYVYKKEDLND